MGWEWLSALARRPASLYGVANRFLDLISERVLLADGAMGTMLHAAEPTLDDYQGHEGCVEILNVTMPDVVRGVHDAYLTAGADCIETNTFGANLTALGEYDLGDRIFELSHAAARLAREVADGHATAERPCCATPTRSMPPAYSPAVRTH
jgi:5-methyltetrahydrofolate--homocysteine methyltransferase